MSTKISLFICFILIAISISAGVLLSARLPDPMPSHWNAAGQVDGYTSKFLGIWLLPLATLGLTLLLAFIPAIDPLKANIEQFRGLYNAFIIGFVVYMLYVYALTLLAALGYQFNMTMMMLPAMGLLFIGIGYLMQNAKRNFFIGIRTPWTLSSDYVWDETHKLGAKTFMVGGVLVIVSAFLGLNGIWLMLVALLGAALIPVVYSYLLFARKP